PILILSNVQVLTAGTRMEQDQEKGKPMQVTVVTLLVYPEQSERLALASTEGKIQLALRNPMDQGAPETPGIKPAVLLGLAQQKAPAKAAPAPGTKRAPGPVTQAVPNATSIDLLVGRSTILNVASPIAKVSLTVPDIADALVTAPNQLLVHGKTPGTISLFVWDRAGGITTYEVNVRRDLSQLI